MTLATAVVFPMFFYWNTYSNSFSRTSVIKVETAAFTTLKMFPAVGEDTFEEIQIFPWPSGAEVLHSE